MSNELKPCPFCGELPSAEHLGEDGYYLVCANIDCESMDGLSPKAWNTRPIEDALRAENAQLRKAIEGILEKPDGCPMCDSGVLRNPAKDHWPDCPFKAARDALRRLSATVERDADGFEFIEVREE